MPTELQKQIDKKILISKSIKFRLKLAAEKLSIPIILNSVNGNDKRSGQTQIRLFK